jgi:cell division protein FtsI/penicillin-binding protein 2
MTLRDQDELPFEPPLSRGAASESLPRIPAAMARRGARLVRAGEPAQPTIIGRSSPMRPIDSAPVEFELTSDEAAHDWSAPRIVERFFAVPPPVDPLKKNGRLYTALAFILLAFVLVGAKLFKIQVLDHASFSREAAEQYKMEMPLAAKRGLIRDRNGIILAANAFVVKYAVDPRAIQHKDKLAQLFSGTFGKPVTAYMALFNDTSRRYVVIEKEVPIEVAARIDTIKDHGLIRALDSRRNYAFSERASHVIGFTSKDARGLAGIELIANHDLGGQPGFQVMQKDGHGGHRADVDYERVPAIDGENLTLTVDEAIQSITEAALKKGVETAKAEAGIVIVMRPSTGEILALANVPDFDPNHFGLATNDMLRNRAITDAYEPG